MFDFLRKFKKEWTPDEILTDNTAIVDINASSNLTDIEDVQLAERLANQLNTIIDYQERMDALNYLAKQARANFDNITYTTIDDGLINAIITIGGTDGTVDFLLAEEAVRLVIEWIEKTSLESLTGTS